MTRLLAILFIVGCIIVAQASAHANVVKPDDWYKLASLAKKARDLHLDIRSSASTAFDGLADTAGGDPVAVAITLDWCLSNLISAAASVQHNLVLITAETQISAAMKDKGDEAVTLQSIRATITDIGNVFPLHRRIANEAAGRCQSSALVNSRAQALIVLIRETEDVIVPLARRVGPP